MYNVSHTDDDAPRGGSDKGKIKNENLWDCLFARNDKRY